MSVVAENWFIGCASCAAVTLLWCAWSLSTIAHELRRMNSRR